MYKKKKVKNKISKFQNGNLFGWRRKSGKKSLLVLEISKYWRSIVFYWIVLMGEGPTDFSKLWFFVIFSSENKFSLYNPYLLLSLSTASFWNFLCLWAATPFTFWRSHFPDAVVEFLLSPPPKPYSLSVLFQSLFRRDFRYNSISFLFFVFPSISILIVDNNLDPLLRFC